MTEALTCMNCGCVTNANTQALEALDIQMADDARGRRTGHLCNDCGTAAYDGKATLPDGNGGSQAVETNTYLRLLSLKQGISLPEGAELELVKDDSHCWDPESSRIVLGLASDDAIPLMADDDCYCGHGKVHHWLDRTEGEQDCRHSETCGCHAYRAIVWPVDDVPGEEQP